MRLAWALLQPRTDAAIDRLPDQREYLSLAQNLLHQHQLRFLDTRFGQWIYAYRTPGYPLFLAAMDALPSAARIAQAAIDTSTVWASYLLALVVSSQIARPARHRLALAAALLLAVNPFLIYFSGLILSETLFVALLAWGTFLLATQRVWVASVLLAAAILVRPSGLMFAPALVLAAVGLNPRPPRPYLYQAGRNLLVLAAVVFLVLLPWAARDRRVVGSWVWTTTNGGITLYDGFNPTATGASDQRFVTRMPQLRPITEVRRSAELTHLAIAWIKAHPQRSLWLIAVKIARTWSPWPLSDQFGRPMYRVLAAAYAVPVDLLVLLTLLRQGILGRRAKLLLCMIPLCVTVVHGLSVGSLRYRLPAEPVLAVLAAAALVPGDAVGRVPGAASDAGPVDRAGT